MATTTTIYPSGDTFLREDIPATNYGTSTLLRVGQYSGTNRRHALLNFKTSSVSVPASRVVSSVLTLTEQNTFGSTTRTMKLCRNTQSATNISTATWATYDGSTAWSDGGEANSAQTKYGMPYDPKALWKRGQKIFIPVKKYVIGIKIEIKPKL